MQSRSKASAAQQKTGSSKRIKIHSVQTKHLCAGIRALQAAPAPLIGVGAGGTAGGRGQRGWVTAAASSTCVSPRLSQPHGEMKGRLGDAQGELGHPSCQNPPGEGETTQSCPPNPPLVPAESHCQGSPHLHRTAEGTWLRMPQGRWGRQLKCAWGAGTSVPPTQTIGAFERSECGATARPHHEAPLSAA